MNVANKQVSINAPDVAIMGSDPIPNLSPENIQAWLALHEDEKELATAFAAVSNKFWWVEDDEYDYEKGTPGHEEAVNIANAWGDLMDELEREIFVILKKEYVDIPKTKQMEVLKLFMKRNGYCDEDGWWIPIDTQ